MTPSVSHTPPEHVDRSADGRFVGVSVLTVDGVDYLSAGDAQLLLSRATNDTAEQAYRRLRYQASTKGTVATLKLSGRQTLYAVVDVLRLLVLIDVKNPVTARS